MSKQLDTSKMSKEDRELSNSIKKETSLDWGNVFESIIDPKYSISDSFSKNNVQDTSKISSKNNKENNIYKNDRNNIDLSPILYEIGKYKFSSVNTQKEVEQVASMIKEVIYKKIVSKVVNNTKEICKYASNFYQSDNSIKGIFDILNNKYSMKAVGDFSGEEFLYCAAQGNEIVGLVLSKDTNGEYIDISDKFNIEINKV